MKAVNCLKGNGSVSTLPLIASESVSPAVKSLLARGTVCLTGCAIGKLVPSTTFDILGAVAEHAVALHAPGLPGAFLCNTTELLALNTLVTEGLTSTVDASACLVRALQMSAVSEGYLSGILENLAIASSQLAAETEGMEAILHRSDSLKRRKVRIETDFPYHCGSDHGQKMLFATTSALCNQFIPSVKHRDKVLTQFGSATFVGVTNVDGDWIPFWHKSGLQHASMWLEAQVCNRVVIGQAGLAYNGPTRDCAVGEADPPARYLHTTSKAGPYDESKWLNEGLFGVAVGQRIGKYEVLGVGAHNQCPDNWLDLFLRCQDTNTIVPLSRTRGLRYL